MRCHSLLQLIFAAAILLGLSGCRDDAEVTVIKLAHGLDTEHPVHKAMVSMAEEVAEQSEGRMRIDIYPSEQLGAERECLEKVQLGILSMVKASSAPIESFIPTMKVFGLPYLFRDSEHMWRVLEGPLGDEILAAAEAKNLKGLCFYDAGARSFYIVSKPIREPADLGGLKIRVQKSAMAMRMVEAMGGSATPIDWGELYSALQQGVVDGAENNAPSFVLSHHYEICRYYVLDEHVRQPDVLLMNLDQWNALTADEQRILRGAVDASVAYQRKLWDENSAAALATVEAADVEVIRPDPAPFRAAVQSMWAEFEGTPLGDLARRIQEVE